MGAEWLTGGAARWPSQPMTAALTSTNPSSKTVIRQSFRRLRARKRRRWARTALTGGGDSNLTCNAQSTDSNSETSITPRFRVSRASKQRLTCHEVRSGRIRDSKGAKRESGISSDDRAPATPASSQPWTSCAKAAASARLRFRVSTSASERMWASYERYKRASMSARPTKTRTSWKLTKYSIVARLERKGWSATSGKLVSVSRRKVE
mmetsp:Transcript_20114/g.61173  ORF Transcript_20114/g.61173 Transcript_20114/m.61173 type:complete len:208 (-) Transcript_20114:770-1393(-)